jgi:hypothetical protein
VADHQHHRFHMARCQRIARLSHDFPLHRTLALKHRAADRSNEIIAAVQQYAISGCSSLVRIVMEPGRVLQKPLLPINDKGGCC